MSSDEMLFGLPPYEALRALLGGVCYEVEHIRPTLKERLDNSAHIFET